MSILDEARIALLSTPQMSGFNKKQVYSVRKFVSSQQQDIVLNYGSVVRYIELTWVDTRREDPYVMARYWERIGDVKQAVYTENGWSFR